MVSMFVNTDLNKYCLLSTKLNYYFSIDRNIVLFQTWFFSSIHIYEGAFSPVTVIRIRLNPYHSFCGGLLAQQQCIQEYKGFSCKSHSELVSPSVRLH